MARPTKYSEEILALCQEYLDTYTEVGDVMPSHIGMFLFINVPKSTAYDWANPDAGSYQEEFSEILRKCKDMQHQKLMNEGLKGEFNAAITKLALGKHGYSDKVEQDVTTGGEKISNNFQIMPVTTKKD